MRLLIIKKVFVYDEDIEEVGKKIDRKQKKCFSDKETDAIFAIYQDIEAFNIERKDKIFQINRSNKSRRKNKISR